MPRSRKLRTIPLAQAVKLFETEFQERYPESRVIVHDRTYEEEDLDLDVYVDADNEADELEADLHASEVCRLVQEATGYFILAFVENASKLPEQYREPGEALEGRLPASTAPAGAGPARRAGRPPSG